MIKIIKIFNKEIPIKKFIIIVITCILFVVLTIVGYIQKENDGEILVSKNSDSLNTKSNNATQAKNVSNEVYKSNEVVNSQQDEIKVYVVGCVARPGIVTLKKGQLINDAVNKVGGFTNEADTDNINLVYELKQNVMIKIKKKDEVIVKTNNQTQTVSQAKSANTGVEIIKDAGLAVEIKDNKTLETGGANTGTKIINLNAATIEELDTLPGIGKATAESILKFREQKGEFKKKEDLMEISGIGQGKFDKIKDLVTVE